MKQVFRVVGILFMSCILFACGESTTATEYMNNARRYLNNGESTAATIEH